MYKQVLYFSIWQKSREEFADKTEQWEKDCDFQIIKDVDFSCASDLLLFLDKHFDCLKQLYVIIDYLPFFSEGCNYEKEAEFISKSIMGYPEVYFLFDESYINNNPRLDFTLFLFKNTTQIGKLVKRYHCFNINDKYPFCALTNHRSNLFDGTNLRYCLKCDLYDTMKVDRHNYKRIQSSRSNNLAVCVEEERSQNKFNSYSLYANGFRVWPIMSAFELKDFNKTNVGKEDLRLIVRDYDLQFSDADIDNEDLEIDSIKREENLVDYIRGAKYVEKDNKWYSYEIKMNNPFWNNLNNIPRFYVSKGVEGVDIVTNKEKYDKLCNKYGIGNEIKKNSLFNNEANHQILRGMYKPVTGIYSFQNYKIIQTRYNEDVRWDERERLLKHCNISDEEKKKKEDDYYIYTARKNHEHGVPLDIYDLTKEMIDRASKYQKEADYVLSAMVAQEAIEVLNGFHEQLMLNAYHIYVVSENAICMNLLGGNENRLMKDVFFRVNKIQHELKRMLARTSAKEKEEEENRKNLHANILNRIFSDCRLFCKKKEHFRSESIFIGAMAHLNEGYELSDIKYELHVILKKIKTIWLYIVK